MCIALFSDAFNLTGTFSACKYLKITYNEFLFNSIHPCAHISWSVHLFCDILPPDQVDRSVGVGQDRLDCLS